MPIEWSTRPAGPELLSTAQMAEVDRRAVAAAGLSGSTPQTSFDLMLSAGRAVADAAAAMAAGGRIAIICGPGNNGGDGFVAAATLARRGYAVDVALHGEAAALAGDAALAAALWRGPVATGGGIDLKAADLVVDALFGAGLSRPLDGAAAALVNAINAARRPVLAVDVPSGLDGNTGAARGAVVQADRTVTFFRAKPGHLLMPGRALCGTLQVADIGIAAQVLAGLEVATFRNGPDLWASALPSLAVDAHKYVRGHAVVVSGPPEMTGAARLGARAALRVGAGLVTVASPRAAFPVNAAHLTAIMVRPFEVPEGLGGALADRRITAVLLGPGAGIGDATRRQVNIALEGPTAVVLDADALGSFAETAETRARLFNMIKGRAGGVVLTPHDGEFDRLFGADVGLANGGSKLDRARRAAALSGAVIVSKGADTVIAHPDGRAVINDNAPPTLATAGSGDVLAGLVSGLVAQGMAPFQAAAAAVWMHGAAATAFGPGLIAEDLPEMMPRVLAELGAAQADTRRRIR